MYPGSAGILPAIGTQFLGYAREKSPHYEEVFTMRPGWPALVRLKACVIGEVEVLFRYTLSGL